MSDAPIPGGPGDMDEEALKRFLKETFGDALPEGALDGLDLAHLQALEALLVAHPAEPPDLATLLATDEDTAARLTSDLRELALAWRSPEGLRPARTLGQVGTMTLGQARTMTLGQTMGPDPTLGPGPDRCQALAKTLVQARARPGPKTFRPLRPRNGSGRVATGKTVSNGISLKFGFIRTHFGT